MKPEEIRYEDLSALMVKAIPEVAQAYEKELHWWKDEKPGQHIIFADILVPHIVSLLEKGDRDEELKRVFEFLELLANHPDEHVQEVVHNSICEPICSNEVALQKSKKYMGPATVRFCSMIVTWEPPKKK